MKITIIPQYSVNLFPALYFLAVALARQGARIQFMSRHGPVDAGISTPGVDLLDITPVHGPAARIPGLRSNMHGMVRGLVRYRPDWIVAQHECLVPALLYGLLPGSGRVRLAGYFCDHYSHGRGMAVIGRLAHRLDAYVDVCDLRLGWRRQEWPGMRAAPFVLRQAPLRIDDAPAAHDGPIRLIHTGSPNILRMNRDRLSRFVARLCGNGIALDWYMSGPSEVRSRPDLLAEARTLCDHPLYRVHAAVGKSELMALLRHYDAGLLWAPLAEQGGNRSYFLSAASNKIGEYIASGLIVAHTGNPGLAYLPAAVAAAFDPTDPEAGADRLAAVLGDRAAVEHRRRSVFRYHQEQMNFEIQAAPLVRHIMAG